MRARGVAGRMKGIRPMRRPAPHLTSGVHRVRRTVKVAHMASTYDASPSSNRPVTRGAVSLTARGSGLHRLHTPATIGQGRRPWRPPKAEHFRASRKLRKKERTATLTLPSFLIEGEGKREPHRRFLAASRAALLLNWCWCVHPMRAGAADQRIRLRVPPAGRLGGIVRCGCNLSLAARMAY